MHAGKTAAEAKAEGSLRLEMSKWVFDSHGTTGVDPRTIVLQLIAYWQWRLNEYGRLQATAIEAAERLHRAHQAGKLLLAQDNADDQNLAADGGDDGQPLSEPPALQVARADLEQIFASGGVTAIVGNRYDADRFGRVYAVDEGLRALETLVGQASDRLARLCKDAITAGFEQQRIELAKLAGGMLATVIVNVLTRHGVKANEQLFGEIEEEMAAVAAVQVGGGGS